MIKSFVVKTGLSMPIYGNKEHEDKELYVSLTKSPHMKHYGLNEHDAKKLSLARWEQIKDYRTKVNELILKLETLYNETDETRQRCNYLEDAYSSLEYFLHANDNTELLLSPSCPDRDFQAGYNLALTSIKKILQKQSK